MSRIELGNGITKLICNDFCSNRGSIWSIGAPKISRLSAACTAAGESALSFARGSASSAAGGSASSVLSGGICLGIQLRMYA